jgi:hypothetical protein
VVPDCIQAAIFYWCGPKETTRGEALLPVETSYAGVYARFRWGYPRKAGHHMASTTYRDGLTTLPGHRQFVKLR